MNYGFVDAILFTGKDGSPIIRAIIDDSNDTMLTAQKFKAENLNKVFQFRELDKNDVAYDSNSAKDKIIDNKGMISVI